MCFRCDSVQKLQQKFEYLKSLLNDTASFKSIYRYAFDFARVSIKQRQIMNICHGLCSKPHQNTCAAVVITACVNKEYMWSFPVCPSRSFLFCSFFYYPPKSQGSSHSLKYPYDIKTLLKSLAVLGYYDNVMIETDLGVSKPHVAI